MTSHIYASFNDVARKISDARHEGSFGRAGHYRSNPDYSIEFHLSVRARPGIEWINTPRANIENDYPCSYSINYLFVYLCITSVNLAVAFHRGDLRRAFAAGPTARLRTQIDTVEHRGTGEVVALQVRALGVDQFREQFLGSPRSAATSGSLQNAWNTRSRSPAKPAATSVS